MTIDLSSQRAFVYRGGRLIGISTISSGKPGYETPTGTFTVLQKEKIHHSNLYDDAPMPYMERLAWSGLALHAGHLRGYPASHGCIRLPMGFAAALFREHTRGMQVVITGEAPSKDEILAARDDARDASRCCEANEVTETGDLQPAQSWNTEPSAPRQPPCCERAAVATPAIPSASPECADDPQADDAADDRVDGCYPGQGQSQEDINSPPETPPDRPPTSR